MLVYPRTSFLRNPKGYPVLSKAHQQYFSQFVRLRFPPWILLADVDPIDLTSTIEEDGPSAEPTPAEAAAKSREKPKDPTSHLRYIRHLQHTQPSRPPIERFGQGYQDYVQAPLQPLTDNLESITYEVFEKDPIKYEWYKQATAEALKDLHAAKVKGSDNAPIIIAVVGSGRGPLVTRALQASQDTGIPIRCFAVEKNPNAHVLLLRRNARDPLWGGRVTVVQSDMRSWQGPAVLGADGQPQEPVAYEKVDILISELLGSFADNELSPECLDGVQHVLHPGHGVNIPQRYSAHCTPIATPRLRADLLSRPGEEKWELPSVVMLQQIDFLCMQKSVPDTPATTNASEDTPPVSDPAPSTTAAATTPPSPDVQEAWSFSHPIPLHVLDRSTPAGEARVDNSHNTRACRLTFTAKHRGICHGLAGYFETVLYASTRPGGRTIELSTNPVTMDAKSKDMISWFPIWFPLKVRALLPCYCFYKRN